MGYSKSIKRKGDKYMKKLNKFIIELVGEKDLLSFRLTAVPFVVCCVVILITTIVGDVFGLMSQDEINGQYKSLIIYFFINYINLAIIEFKK